MNIHNVMSSIDHRKPETPALFVLLLTQLVPYRII